MIDKLAELLVFGFMPLMIGAIALPQPVSAETPTVEGELLYLERMALPPDAVAVVTLAEVPENAATGNILASREIRNPGQVPIRFALDVDPDAIKLGRRYTISGQISVDGKTWFAGELSGLDSSALSSVRLILKKAP